MEIATEQTEHSEQSQPTPIRIPENFLKRLEPLEPRFVINEPRSKKAFQKDWQKYKKAHPLESPELQSYLASGFNYGVLVDHGIIIIDADTPLVNKLAEENLPETLVVKSGRADGGRHRYYKGEWNHVDGALKLFYRGEEIGHISGRKTQVIGPGSIHPNGNPYTVEQDRPLAEVTMKQLLDLFWPYLKEKKINHDKFIDEAQRETKNTDYAIPITAVINIAGLRRQGDELYGSHPLHGSETGHNFWVNTKKNCWRCWRCDSGGGPYQWLAVEMGLIQCREAQPGALQGDRFKLVLEEARRRHLIPDHEEKIEPQPYGTAEILYEELLDYFKEHLDLIPEYNYDILAAWTLATWNIDRLETIAYLMFRGLWGSGKTRAMDVLELVAYNSENCAIITQPAMNRILAKKTSTFFIDEFDKLTEQKLQSLLPILNAGYQRGKFATICDKDDPDEILRLPCFGPKAIALIKGTEDAFTSRCIYIPMYKNELAINYRINRERAAQLKPKLKQWQLDTQNQPPENVEDLFLQALKPVKNYRLVQLFEPLAASIPPSRRPRLVKIAQEIEAEEANEEIDQLYEDLYFIVKTLMGGSETAKQIMLSDIYGTINEGKQEGDDDYLTPKQTGVHLNTMGFNKAKRTKQGMARIIHPETLRRLGRRFERGQQTLT